MNRTFYLFAIFLLGLSSVCRVFQSIIYFQINDEMYFLQPFANWFLVVNLIVLVETFFLLKYFRRKKFDPVFWTGLVTSILMLCQFILIYIILIFVARELQGYVIFILVFIVGAGILFASSLIFSNAKVRSWLKTAGVFMLIQHLVFGGALLWTLVSPDFLVIDTFKKIQQWTSLAGCLISVSFIMNFRSELKLLPADEVNATRQESIPVAMGMLAFVFVFILGGTVARESYWALDWRKKGPLRAQKLAKAFESRIYVNRQMDTMRYLFMKPLDYDPGKKYPFVVCLHGGPVPVTTDKIKQVNVPEPATLLSDQVNREKYPAFIFVPQGPPGNSWGGIPGIPSVDSLVFETIHALENEFEIDVKRRYVAGGSMGGYGAWYFIGTHPEMFAAAIPYCGAGDPRLAHVMVDVPIWAFHGSIDRNVPVSGSREMIEAIKNAGGNPRYTEFPGVGHNVWPDIKETPGVLDWLFAQRRD